MEVEITHAEFFDVTSQLYPEQTARVLAEIRAKKLEEVIEQLTQGKEDGNHEGTD
jgi:hypothetical protein